MSLPFPQSSKAVGLQYQREEKAPLFFFFFFWFTVRVLFFFGGVGVSQPHSIAEAGLKLTTLFYPCKCYNYRHELPCLATLPLQAAIMALRE